MKAVSRDSALSPYVGHVLFSRGAVRTLFMGAVLLVAAESQAHDVRGIAVEMESATRAINAALVTVPAADLRTRSVLNNLRLWPVPRAISVCFMPGTPMALRKRVAESLQRVWPISELSRARLDFDAASLEATPECTVGINRDVQEASADISISFTPGSGHWSYVGIESLKHMPSMNFDGFTETNPNAAEFDRLVAHELGHALGLEHEHQSPGLKEVCGWKFDWLSANYTWPPEADIKAYFVKLTQYVLEDRHAYIFSLYDKSSIMHYAFPANAFERGDKSPCFITQNYKISDQDKNAIRIAYGPLVGAQQNLAREAIPEVWTRFDDPALRNLLTLKSKILPK